MRSFALGRKLKGSQLIDYYLLAWFISWLSHRITPNLEQYLRKISVADYETKVPENIRTINAEKLQSYQAELAATQQAIEAFLKLKA
jgi:hypothetical protein